MKIEILDLETGCSYIKEGKTIADCVKQFQAMFFIPHKYKLYEYEKKSI